jgi:hypothetical protein
VAYCRVVLLGEASHGTAEFYRARAAITQRLIEEHGFGRDEALPRRLVEPRLKRFIGVIYRPETELTSHYAEASVAWQFDGYVWIDQTTEVAPLGPEHAKEGLPYVSIWPVKWPAANRIRTRRPSLATAAVVWRARGHTQLRAGRGTPGGMRTECFIIGFFAIFRQIATGSPKVLKPARSD